MEWTFNKEIIRLNEVKDQEVRVSVVLLSQLICEDSDLLTDFLSSVS